VLGALATATAGQAIVTNMLGVAETGLYVVGLQMGAAMGLISDALVKTYAPWLYAKLKVDSVASRQFIVGVTYCVLASLLLLSAIMSAAIILVFPLIVGDEFQAAKSLTPWFVFGNGFVGMYYAVAGLFFFSSKTHFVSIATLSAGVMAVCAMWILGEAFGLKGVAIGYCVSQAATFVLAWLISRWAYPMPWFGLRAAVAALSSRQSQND
jgi:O-antigen/teichoic acid export membrane protein